MKLYWGSSVGRSMEPDHVNSVVDFLGHTPHAVYWKPIHGDALIERSRARSATAFLEKSDADVWLSVDSDIVFGWRDLVRIAEEAEDKRAIVVGAYVTRSPLRTFPTSLIDAGQRIRFEDTPSLVSIRYGATGFMAVHRSVFQSLADHDPEMVVCHPDDDLRHRPFFLPFVTEGARDQPILLSEDFAFCHRARSAGFHVYLDTGVRIGHLGPYLYRLDDMANGPPKPATPLRLTRTTDGYPAVYTVETPELVGA